MTNFQVFKPWSKGRTFCDWDIEWVFDAALHVTACTSHCIAEWWETLTAKARQWDAWENLLLRSVTFLIARDKLRS